MHALQRILVIDDDADIQEVVGAALEDFGGYIVEGCTSGAAALGRAPLFSPDLILLDLAMPGMDGLTTLQELRTLARVVQTPVIFFTAKATDPSALLQLPGVVGVLAKPFHHRHLVAHINALWESHMQMRQMVPDYARIAAIRQRYLQALPGRCDTITALWTVRTYGALAAIRHHVHQLAGSGASLGFAELSATATLLETEIALVLASGGARHDIVSVIVSERITALLNRLYQAVRQSPDAPPQWPRVNDRADAEGA